ncbi:MAG: hypothetical protein RIA08_20445 [Roseovarius sp.]|uniref:dioxygenase family protein n=1 Tax=Roseovarius sp. TaxID=1486281 RepID=UPI0032EDDC53
MSNPTPRRRFLRTAAGFAALGVLSRPAQAALLTPRQTEGPFYPTGSMRRADIDNDLVRIAGAVRQAGGHIIRLTGRVLDRSGRPIPEARVEIWQCDAQGNYMHPRDRRSADHDPAFQGFGHDITGADGRYTFRTIKPVPYPGRTPHIHVKAFAGGRELTTQFYLADEPANQRDGLFRRLSQAEQNAVLMRFEETGKDPQASVDITL